MTRFFIAALLSSFAICAPAAPAQAPSLFVDSRSTTIEAAGRLNGPAKDDALFLARFPSASWLAYGSPDIVEAKARDIVSRALAARQVPVLVAYNIPYRDCALYSAGGAADSGAYHDWIGGLARGIGDRPAIVILEPDGLGVIPWHRTLTGEFEGCRPEGQGKAAAARRYEELRGALPG